MVWRSCIGMRLSCASSERLLQFSLEISSLKCLLETCHQRWQLVIQHIKIRRRYYCPRVRTCPLGKDLSLDLPFAPGYIGYHAQHAVNLCKTNGEKQFIGL